MGRKAMDRRIIEMTRRALCRLSLASAAKPDAERIDDAVQLLICDDSHLEELAAALAFEGWSARR